LAGAFATCAVAQEWPAKPVRIINPFNVGTSTDVVARVIAEHMQKRFDKPFVVESKPGAGGMIGTADIARAAPDGYTFGVSIPGPLVNNLLLFKKQKMPFDPFTDLAAITLAVHQPCAIVANKELNVNTIPELMAEFKRHSGKYNYGLIGAGGLTHLMMATLVARSGGAAVPLTYNGAGAAVTAIMRGDVHVGCLPANGVLGQIKSGQVRTLAVSTAKRASQLPDIPTVQEQGLPGVVGSAWVGVVAPGKTPKALVDRINKEVVAALRRPEAAAMFDKLIMDVVANTPEEFDAYRREELARWKPVVEQNNISIE
jgi:tripartite-type tricarboxylate transporter receptor subunit TctC